MAAENLTLLVGARGARATKRDVDEVGDSVEGVGRRSRRASKDAGIFGRAVPLMGVRATVAAVAVGALGLATAATPGRVAT